MFNLDPGKLFVILIVGIILVGPERLPRLTRQAGALWQTLMQYREKTEVEIRKAMPDHDLPRIPRNPSAAVSSYLMSLMASSGGDVASQQHIGIEQRTELKHQIQMEIVHEGSPMHEESPMTSDSVIIEETRSAVFQDTIERISLESNEAETRETTGETSLIGVPVLSVGPLSQDESAMSPEMN